MSYNHTTFDKSQLSFDASSKKCIAIDQSSKLHKLLITYIASNIIHTDENSGNFEVSILSGKSKNKDIKVINCLVFDRVALQIGFGVFSFFSKKKEKFIALHQKIGEPVGTNCSAVIMSNLTIFTDGPIDSLASFLSEIIADSEDTSAGMFTCLTWHIRHQYWKTEAKVSARPLESVVLPTELKSKLVKDLDKFLSPKTKEFYSRNGIPYRRSYLFHGIPGTGKTSMVQALAGHFDRCVCYLMPTHPDMTDDSLRDAINQVPDDAIVVFEDIDSLFSKDRSNKVSKSSLTFSGLLNALDGIGSTNGQIFILTTNLRDELDPALIRKGRVDMHVEFTYAIEDQMIQMWNNFYPLAVALSHVFASNLTQLLTSNNMQVTTSGLQHFFVTQMDATADEALHETHAIIDEIKLNTIEKNEEDMYKLKWLEDKEKNKKNGVSKNKENKFYSDEEEE